VLVAAILKEDGEVDMVTLGLIINPIAGIGGRAGLKGSDGEDIQKLALARGGTLEAGAKAEVALSELVDLKEEIRFLAQPGAMGGDVLEKLGFSYQAVESSSAPSSASPSDAAVTSAEDTVEAALQMAAAGVDLLVFAGGDGTARDIYRTVGLSVPCVGIPAGVKIHSAVYANNPKSAGQVIRRFCANPSTASMVESEVMDLDEDLVRQNIVEAKLYGYLTVPRMQNLMQQAKASARFSAHDIEGIASEIADLMQAKAENTVYIFGTGGTTYKVMEHLGLQGSLLGVDVVAQDGRRRIVLADASETELYECVKDAGEVVLIVTAIGGQGHIFGRGNQQISPRVIRLVERDNLWIVSAAEKIYGLEDNTLHVDTSDPELDCELSGYRKVITGWQERIVCKVEA
jgi:predicted polyphosphate/ATP-dependent NAD kinase